MDDEKPNSDESGSSAAESLDKAVGTSGATEADADKAAGYGPEPDGDAYRLLSWFVHGSRDDLRQFIGLALAVGWEVSYREDRTIKCGERSWWTISPKGVMRDAEGRGPGGENCDGEGEKVEKDGAGGPAILDRFGRDRSEGSVILGGEPGPDGQVSEALHFLGKDVELAELFRHLKPSFRMILLGYDGGWGGEPHVEVVRRHSERDRV